MFSRLFSTLRGARTPLPKAFQQITALLAPVKTGGAILVRADIPPYGLLFDDPPESACRNA
jgi:hypothetical protein